METTKAKQELESFGNDAKRGMVARPQTNRQLLMLIENHRYHPRIRLEQDKGYRVPRNVAFKGKLDETLAKRFPVHEMPRLE